MVCGCDDGGDGIGCGGGDGGNGNGGSGNASDGCVSCDNGDSIGGYCNGDGDA